MLKCFSLAQADAHITKELIETEVVQVQSLVEMLSHSEYRKALGTDPVLKNLIVYCVEIMVPREKVTLSLKRILLMDVVFIT